MNTSILLHLVIFEFSQLHLVFLMVKSTTSLMTTTPWLGSAWRVRDLSFTHGYADISGSLQTLLVELKPQKKTIALRDKKLSCGGAEIMNLSGYNSFDVDGDKPMNHGVGNAAQYGLGIALLQIYHAQNLEPADVLDARILANLASPLGPRYQELKQIPEG